MAIKILFLSHRFYPDIGGIEINSEILAGEFVKAGYEVVLATMTGEEGDKSFSFPVARKPKLSRLIQMHKWADVVYENNPALRLSWPALLLGKTSVVALRTWISRADGSTALQDKLKFKWLKRASGVIAVSNAVREECWRDATVIGNPYRSEIFHELEDIPREQNFVFLGRLVSDKGADIAIKAVHQLISEGYFKNESKPILTVVGDGKESENLRTLAGTLNMSDSVVFTGTLRGKALVECLNRHKYLLVPSFWKEPFGNVALEGMACGCLPFVSDGGGLPDAVGEGGVVFKRGDADSLAQSIRNVLDNPDLEKSCRSNAALHLVAHVPHRVAKDYLRVIERAHNSKRSQNTQR